MKWYEVHNYASGNEYVNDDSDISNPENIWTTDIPWNFNPAEDYEPSKPYRFEKRTDATRIKDMLKSARLADWNENRYIYDIFGRKRPNWKVYTFES